MSSCSPKEINGSQPHKNYKCMWRAVANTVSYISFSVISMHDRCETQASGSNQRIYQFIYQKNSSKHT